MSTDGPATGTAPIRAAQPHEGTQLRRAARHLIELSGEEPFDLAGVTILRWHLVSAINAHLSLAERALVVPLAASGDADARRDIGQLASAIIALRTTVDDFSVGWTADRIRADVTGFIAETERVSVQVESAVATMERLAERHAEQLARAG